MIEELFLKIQEHKNKVIIIFVALIVADVFVFHEIFAGTTDRGKLKIYFLDVGQGDSELVVLPGGAKILIDGGPPNGKVLDSISRALPAFDRYIDLVVLSHPELDHFGGLIDVLKRYKVGVFLMPDRAGTHPAFKNLAQEIYQNKIKSFALLAGDKIKNGDSIFNIISPNKKELAGRETNDSAVVALLESNGASALFTGDISSKIEGVLLKIIKPVDILKIPHHGSKYSSSENFIDALKPKIAAIEVGKNSYGHPTPRVLKTLTDAGVKIFRTDLDGVVELVVDKGTINVFKKL